MVNESETEEGVVRLGDRRHGIRRQGETRVSQDKVRVDFNTIGFPRDIQNGRVVAAVSVWDLQAH